LEQHKSHLWYYTVSSFVGTCGYCDGGVKLMIDSHQVLWSKISEAILLFTLHAFGGFVVAPRAAVLVTRDVKTFASYSFCA